MTTKPDIKNISCFYDNCVSLENKRKAYRDVRQDVLDALSDLWQVRIPVNAQELFYKIPPFLNKIVYPQVYLSEKMLRKYIKNTYHISQYRAVNFSLFSNLMFYNTFKQFSFNGNIMEVIFYTRYRRRKAQSYNEIFALRLWIPVPLNMSCKDTIIKYAKDVSFQEYVKKIISRLIYFSIFSLSGTIELNAKGINTYKPMPSQAIKVYGQINNQSPLGLALKSVFDVVGTSTTLQEDIERLRDMIPSYFTSEETEDLIRDFIEYLPATEIRIGCRLLGADILNLIRKIDKKFKYAMQLAYIDNSCNNALNMLSSDYCSYMNNYYMYPNENNLKLTLRTMGEFTNAEISFRKDAGKIIYPLGIWANGLLKQSLLMPTLAFIERMRFSQGAVYEFFEKESKQPPREIINQIYDSTINNLLVSKEFKLSAEAFRNEYFEVVVIPLNFFDYLNYLFV